MIWLARWLFGIACIKILLEIYELCHTEKANVARGNFWRAIFTIPTVVFFIIYLF